MKAVILVLSPEECCNLFRGDLSILVRKKFPKDYVGWVYIYCTKGKPYLFHEKGNVFGDDIYELTNDSTSDLPNYKHAYVVGGTLNGKVVAKVWCAKVEETHIYVKNHEDNALLKNSCLTVDEFMNYLGNKPYGYAIHITNLEIFEEPKDLWEFKTPMMAERYKYDLEKAYEDDYEIGTRLAEGIADPKYECANCVELTELSEGYYGLSHAPRSGWCYVAELK